MKALSIGLIKGTSLFYQRGVRQSSLLYFDTIPGKEVLIKAHDIESSEQ
jgi:hypothetical protein